MKKILFFLILNKYFLLYKSKLLSVFIFCFLFVFFFFFIFVLFSVGFLFFLLRVVLEYKIFIEEDVLMIFCFLFELGMLCFNGVFVFFGMFGFFIFFFWEDLFFLFYFFIL